jgi:hypothetical protein
MMQFTIIILVILLYLSTSTKNRHATIHIMVLYNLEGSWANSTDSKTITPLWEKYVNDKFNNDITWPFPIKVEGFNCKSNVSVVRRVMETRLSDKSKPSTIINIISFSSPYVMINTTENFS